MDFHAVPPSLPIANYQLPIPLSPNLHRQETAPMFHKENVTPVWVLSGTKVLPLIMVSCRRNKPPVIVVPYIRARDCVVEAEP